MTSKKQPSVAGSAATATADRVKKYRVTLPYFEELEVVAASQNEAIERFKQHNGILETEHSFKAALLE